MNELLESPHHFKPDEVLRALNSNKAGLTSQVVEERLKNYGKNILVKPHKIKPLKILLAQFESILVIILIISAAITLLLGELIDSLAITAIVVLNAALGFFQEYNAEKAMDALKKLITPHVRVIRDQVQKVINAEELVPGDIIVFESGAKVPADSRLIFSRELSVDESTLTGESTPVHKNSELVLPFKTPIAERENMLFAGTAINSGNGLAVVVSTGFKTEFGKIARLVTKTTSEKTPLQKRLQKLGKQLALVTLFFCGLIFLLELLKQQLSIEILLIIISLAVSAIPEGLPAIVTVVLAIGMRDMAKRNAVIRKLSAVETLGSTSVICTDKTGTLTKNEMTVVRLFIDNDEINVSGAGYKPEGSFFKKEKEFNPLKSKSGRILLTVAKNCNNASINKQGNYWSVIGDPTEGSLIIASKKAGLVEEQERISEFAFTSERKRMTTIHKTDAGLIAYSKGAPEIVLELCSKELINGKLVKLTDLRRKQIMKTVDKFASEALRVLGFAYKNLPRRDPKEFTEKEMIFTGLAGMLDPPREGVIKAINASRSAGIKTVMITGDHKLTAVSIAKKINLLDDQGLIITGPELNSMSEEQLDNIIDSVEVFARVSPEHKVIILNSLKRKGYVVAMTGDGVNDAPALKRADIGIAMGITGTDVSQEASDMLLEDDNFVTIVKAVKRGRVIYDNIKKTVKFLLSSNFDEIFEVGVAAIIGLPLPFLPLQILWVNLVTDSLPAISLSFDKTKEDVMNRPPRNPKEGILSNLWLFILIAGLTDAIVTLVLFWLMLSSGAPLIKARTMAFTNAIMFELFFVFNCRSDHLSVFRLNPFTNKRLVISVIAAFLLQLMVIYVPFMQVIFETTNLNLIDWFLILVFSLPGILIIPKVFIKQNANLKKQA